MKLQGLPLRQWGQAFERGVGRPTFEGIRKLLVIGGVKRLQINARSCACEKNHTRSY